MTFMSVIIIYFDNAFTFVLINASCITYRKEACPVGMSEIFINIHYSVNLTNDLGACMGG